MRWLFGIALVAVGVAASLEARFLYDSHARQLVDGTSPAQGAPLQLLSYNVKGTPWPPLSDRTPDLKAIGAFLRSERGQGAQPHVVVLQEAFSEDAKAIGREAGYRYAAFGPAADAQNPEPPTAADRSFAAQASFWSGETMGKQLDSGLALFSDYPIRWVKRMAFPSFACAGWDCLANKGVLAVGLEVPGMAKPVVVVTTHLNSRAAAGVAPSRSDYAFARQLDVLNAFVATLDTGGGPLLLAGDFNVGRDPARETGFNQLVAARDLSLVAAEHGCGGDCRRAVGAGAEAEARLAAAKSMILYRGAGALLPSILSTFGRAPNGTMLSDHIGLAVRFDLESLRPRKAGAALPV
jgi:endonuclease/exonuclease/phosphatase family metal-dependent hydrolase